MLLAGSLMILLFVFLVLLVIEAEETSSILVVLGPPSMTSRIEDMTKSFSFCCQGDDGSSYSSSAGCRSLNFVVKLEMNLLFELDFSRFSSSTLALRSSSCRVWYFASEFCALIVL